jgi:hypothetical protein
MDAVGLEPIIADETERATQEGRMFFAGGCLTASAQEGLPAHEQVAYLAMWREAIRLARGEAALPQVCRIHHNDLGCVEPDVSIGSREHQFGSGEEGMLRGPMMEASEGRGDAPVDPWEAHAEYDVGVLILRYLEQHPPPRQTELVRDLLAGAQDLESAGLRHLRELGERRLYVV